MQNDGTFEPRKSTFFPVIALLASALLILSAWWVANRPTPLPSARTQVPQRLSGDLKQVFFDSEISPRLKQYSERNRLAIERAVERINSRFDGYRVGIPSFVDDITGWGTRFGIIGRKSGDLWTKWWGEKENATRVHDYVSEKFEKHLFAQKDLEQFLESVLGQFRDDLKANQNMLHAEISSAWHSKGYTSKDLDLEQITAEVNHYAMPATEHMATDSVAVGLFAFVGASHLGYLAKRIAEKILLRVSAMLAAEAVAVGAESGGATVSFTVAGGAGGSAIGPVGTGIGIAVGLVVDLVSDWWMTKKFEEKITGECNVLISGIRDQIMVGTAEAPGLENAFAETVSTMEKAEKTALREALEEVTQ